MTLIPEFELHVEYSSTSSKGLDVAKIDSTKKNQDKEVILEEPPTVPRQEESYHFFGNNPASTGLFRYCKSKEKMQKYTFSCHMLFIEQRPREIIITTHLLMERSKENFQTGQDSLFSCLIFTATQLDYRIRINACQFCSSILLHLLIFIFPLIFSNDRFS